MSRVIYLGLVLILFGCGVEEESRFVNIEQLISSVFNGSNFEIEPEIYVSNRTCEINIINVGEYFNNEAALNSYIGYMMYKISDSLVNFDSIPVTFYSDNKKTKRVWHIMYTNENLTRSNHNFDISPTLVHFIEYCLWNLHYEEYVQCDSALANLSKYTTGLKLDDYFFDGGFMDLLLIHSFECDELIEDSDSIAYKGIHGLYFFYGTHSIENEIYKHMQYFLAYCDKGGINPEILDSIRKEQLRKYGTTDEMEKKLDSMVDNEVIIK